jgi:hypothetical protein
MKYEDVTYRVVHYREAERVIAEYFGRELSIVADQELGNDVVFTLDAREPRLSNYQREDIASFRAGRYVSMIFGTLWTDLVYNGHLDKARYLFTVSW